MSIDIDSTEFDLQGNLTTNGKNDFWKEINRAMRKFDNNDITLQPRKFHGGQVVVPQPNKNTTSLASKILDDFRVSTKQQPKARKCLHYTPDKTQMARKLPTPWKVARCKSPGNNRQCHDRSRS